MNYRENLVKRLCRYASRPYVCAKCKENQAFLLCMQKGLKVFMRPRGQTMHSCGKCEKLLFAHRQTRKLLAYRR